jgi:regulator of sigma E protease
MIDFVTTAIIFFIVLSVLVFVHELGHYMVARLIGVHVEEFGFGLPPRIWGKKIGPTIYSLNWLPIGGFVRLAGEDDLEESVDHYKKTHKEKNLKQFFWARSKTERAAILLAGVTMNFLLATGITSYLLTGGIEEPAPRVKIEEVLPQTPAEQVGLKVGDSIEKISYKNANNETITAPTRIPDELVTITHENVGKEIELIFLRDGKEMTLKVTPRKDFPKGEGPMGVRIGFDIQMLKYPWYEAPFAAVKLNLSRGKDMIVSLATLPSRALQGQKVQNEVAGPIGIAQVTGEAAKIGFTAVLNLMSILSLSLALLNVLPFPALDGGRLLFVVLEQIMGRKVKPALERSAHQIGMLILLGFILLITLNDLSRFVHI